MKKPNKLIACGATALFAAALGLQAQTSSSSTGTQPSTTTRSGSTSSSMSSGSTTPSTSTSSSTLRSQSGQAASSTGGGSQSTLSGGSTLSSQSPTTSGNATVSRDAAGSAAASGSAAGSAAGSFSGSLNTTGSQTTSSGAFSSTAPSRSTTTNTSTALAGTSQSTQNSSISTSTTTESQVTTFVQQLDAQGPAVVQRIETHVGDLACSDDTVQQLVEALHSGKSVTITSNVNGQTKTSTFNASGTRLGYGEAYIALALAAQQLRNAGVTGCATPEQWQAVLLGGPLNVTNSSTTVNTSASASGSSTVPGIVTLHRQGQGWGQIAQTSNLQLGQVISSSDAPSPTGYSSAEMNSGKMNKTDDDTSKGEKKGWWQRFKDRDADDKKKDQDHEPKGHEQNPGNSESSPNR